MDLPADIFTACLYKVVGKAVCTPQLLHTVFRQHECAVVVDYLQQVQVTAGTFHLPATSGKLASVYQMDTRVYAVDHTVIYATTNTRPRSTQRVTVMVKPTTAVREVLLHIFLQCLLKPVQQFVDTAAGAALEYPIPTSHAVVRDQCGKLLVVCQDIDMSLGDLLTRDVLAPGVMDDIFLQIFHGLYWLWRAVGFSHGTLHVNNVLVKRRRVRHMSTYVYLNDRGQRVVNCRASHYRVFFTGYDQVHLTGVLAPTLRRTRSFDCVTFLTSVFDNDIVIAKQDITRARVPAIFDIGHETRTLAHTAWRTTTIGFFTPVSLLDRLFRTTDPDVSMTDES